jgi:hypothetical protein
LHFPAEQPLIGWRLFRVRRSQSGFVLSAPLIHNPDFEPFPSRTIDAICYQAEYPAPAPGCRCGLYAAIDGTLDSLSGYLSDSAHDRDPPHLRRSRVHRPCLHRFARRPRPADRDTPAGGAGLAVARSRHESPGCRIQWHRYVALIAVATPQAPARTVGKCVRSTRAPLYCLCRLAGFSHGDSVPAARWARAEPCL